MTHFKIRFNFCTLSFKKISYFFLTFDDKISIAE